MCFCKRTKHDFLTWVASFHRKITKKLCLQYSDVFQFTVLKIKASKRSQIFVKYSQLFFCHLVSEFLNVFAKIKHLINFGFRLFVLHLSSFICFDLGFDFDFKRPEITSSKRSKLTTMLLFEITSKKKSNPTKYKEQRITLDLNYHKTF